MSAEYDSPLVIGDTFELFVYWEDSASTRIPLLGKTVRFAIKDTDEVFYDETSLTSDDITIPELTDPTRTGEILVTIPASKTTNFPSGSLPYDLEVTEQGIGWRKTILRGKINTLTEVAR